MSEKATPKRILSHADKSADDGKRHSDPDRARDVVVEGGSAGYISLDRGSFGGGSWPISPDGTAGG